MNVIIEIVQDNWINRFDLSERTPSETVQAAEAALSAAFAALKQPRKGVGDA